MQVHEAKAIARKWVEEVGKQEPAFLGAFFAGSINWMPKDAPWPRTSDVDLFLLVDREVAGWSEQKKFLYNGVILEAVVFPLERFRTPEQVLVRIDAANLSIPSIISDPSGHLTKLQRAVAEGYSKREWVRKRCEKARQNVQSDYLEEMIRADTLCDQVLNLLWAVMEMAQIPALAHLRNPTVRKCLVVFGELLMAQGKRSLHESLLTLLGSVGMNQGQVESHLQECISAYDRAIEVISTPFWGDFDVNDQMRPIAVDGSWELIDSGYHREAVFWILSVHTVAQMAIQNDAPEGEKAQFMHRYERVLGELGMGSSADLQHRAELGRSILNDIMKVAEEIMASNSEIKD